MVDTLYLLTFDWCSVSPTSLSLSGKNQNLPSQQIYRKDAKDIDIKARYLLISSLIIVGGLASLMSSFWVGSIVRLPVDMMLLLSKFAHSFLPRCGRSRRNVS
jgi:hypothetical protein